MASSYPGSRADAIGNNRRLGFTVLELVLLVGMLGMLVTFGAPAYSRYQETARQTKAAADITMLQFDIRAYAAANNGQFPPDLNALGRGAIRDPWGNPYRYLNIATAIPGHVRKDRFLVPLNSDYDLYSMGKDGESQPPITSAKSRDDILRASNGAFIGLASDF